MTRHYQWEGAGAALAGAAAAVPLAPTTGVMPGPRPGDCAGSHGRLLGMAPGNVAAFANCHVAARVREANRWRGTYTGIKWQCVEFARRWLLVHRQVVFDEVDCAFDIWERVSRYKRPAGGEDIPVIGMPNGAQSAPAVGDLLVYRKALFGTGHVAVVTEVRPDRAFVEVGEQNYRNALWAGDHARRIPLCRGFGGYWLEDLHLIGWKRMSPLGTFSSAGSSDASGAAV